MFYVNLMVTTKQKSTIHTQKIKKRKPYYHYRKISTYKRRQQERKKIYEIIKQPENNKMVLSKFSPINYSTCQWIAFSN